MVFPLIFILYLNIKNKIFLGDSGIYAVTYIVSYILLKSNNLANKIAAEEIFFIFLIPALEMIRLFIYRLVKNKNPFTADSNHIHHIFLKKINFVKYIFLIISLILSKFFIIFFLKEFIFYFYFIIIILYFYLLIKFNTVVK
jgi:UDP-GlcNAc:undecaprenyl-phosphate GlcNAc-1-phosphate transferase